jgi:endoglucanase
MEKDQMDFLESLISTPSPSGFEEKVQQVFLKRVEDRVDRYYKDVHGNAFGVINPEGKVKVMLAGHCDEIGMMVEYVNDQGYIYFSTVGGIDAHILPGKRVLVILLQERYPEWSVRNLAIFWRTKNAKKLQKLRSKDRYWCSK